MALNKSEIKKYQDRLEELKEQILKIIQSSSDSIKRHDVSLSGTPASQADQDTGEFSDYVSMQLTSKELEILKQVDRALEKIKEETYGVCDITGEAIPTVRLNAVPYATMTVKAQEEIEKNQR